MAIIIETTDDFIRALRQNEEFRTAARRELLTEDLLELPSEFREFRAYAEENFVSVDEFREFRTSVDQRFDGVDQRFGSVDQRFGSVDQRFDGVDQRFDGVDQRFDGVDQRFDSVDQSIRELTNSVNDLRGSSLEGRMSTRLRQRVARTFGLTRPQTIWLAEHYVQPPSRAEAFDSSRERALEGGQISSEEADRLTDTDMIMRSVAPNGETVYVAVEASGVIGDGDISCARHSADILKKLYDAEAIPAVYGFSIASEQVERAKPKDGLTEVHIFLET